jgi:type IV secretion system protein VirB2
MMRLHQQQVLTILMLTVLVLAILPTEAFASATGTGMAYEVWLTTFRNSITGPVAFTIGGVGLAGSGFALVFMSADMNTFLRTMIYLILVMSLVVAGQNIMSGLFGKGAVIASAAPTMQRLAELESMVDGCTLVLAEEGRSQGLLITRAVI